MIDNFVAFLLKAETKFIENKFLSMLFAELEKKITFINYAVAKLAKAIALEQ